MGNVKKVITDDDPRKNDTDFRPRLAALLEQTLDSFGITTRVAEVNNRPKDIEFCLEITLGTSIESIVKLRKDLALAMASYTGDIEIEAPIPGRSLIAIRLPYEKEWFKGQVDYMEKIKLLPSVTELSKEYANKVEWRGARGLIAAPIYFVGRGLNIVGNICCVVGEMINQR